MVIGNPTRTEESAIHGEPTERGGGGGGTGDPAAGGGGKMPKGVEFLSLACLRVQGGDREKMALLGKF